MNNRTPTPPHPFLAGNAPQRFGGNGTRRLNNVPLFIFGGVAALTVVIIVWVCAQRSTPPPKAKEDDHGGSTVQYARAMAGERAGGVIPRAFPSPSPSAAPAVMAAAAALASSAPSPSPTPDEWEKQRRAALLAAYGAKPGVEGGFERLAQQRQQQKAQQLPPQQVAMLQRADPNNVADALEAYRQQLAQAPALTPQNGGYGAPYGAATGDPNRLGNFNGPSNRWALPNRVEPPAGRYVLQTGSVIPAVLITAMDSDLPGAVTAQVSQDVYDSPTGTALLIPKGAKLFGEYVSGNGISYGQNRVFVVWQRIIFPNGNTLDIGAMPGVDQQGMSGFHDSVDSHWVRTFGSALLMSAITAGFTISQPQYGNTNGVSASQALSESLGQNIGNAAAMLLQKNLNVSPTIRIRAGYRFNVTAVKDLTFDRPYFVPSYDAN
jgi:type IV secretory pathway VirB10-like protein